MWTISDIEEIFNLAGCPEDFCANSQDSDKIIFGGWNRIYLYPNGEAKASFLHCRPKFLTVCRQLNIPII